MPASQPPVGSKHYSSLCHHWLIFRSLSHIFVAHSSLLKLSFLNSTPPHFLVFLLSQNSQSPHSTSNLASLSPHETKPPWSSSSKLSCLASGSLLRLFLRVLPQEHFIVLSLLAVTKYPRLSDTTKYPRPGTVSGVQSALRARECDLTEGAASVTSSSVSPNECWRFGLLWKLKMPCIASQPFG